MKDLIVDGEFYRIVWGTLGGTKYGILGSVVEAAYIW